MGQGHLFLFSFNIKRGGGVSESNSRTKNQNYFRIGQNVEIQELKYYQKITKDVANGGRDGAPHAPPKKITKNKTPHVPLSK
jgi:hypothetical protein